MTTKRKIVNRTVKALDVLRKTSDDIHNLVLGTIAELSSIGIKLSFTRYPSDFSHKVRNTHNSPKGYKQNWRNLPELASGYPGWSGRWEGSITVVDTNVFGSGEITLYELMYMFKLYWINCGSGSFGAKFSMGGMIFLYDMDTIKARHENSIDSYKTLVSDLDESVKSYNKKFTAERIRYVTKQDAVQQIAKNKKLLDGLQDLLGQQSTKVENYYKSEFCDTYSVTLPKVNMAGVNDTAVMEAATSGTYHNPEPLPELASTVERIEDLTRQINNFIEDRPEAFI